MVNIAVISQQYFTKKLDFNVWNKLRLKIWLYYQKRKWCIITKIKISESLKLRVFVEIFKCIVFSELFVN